MTEFIKNILPRIKGFSHKLNEQEKFIDKPWGLIDLHGNLIKYIFNRNGKLFRSINGVLTEGKWEFLSGVNSLVIELDGRKSMLKHLFMDDSILALKMDDLNTDILLLVNENRIPDLNINDYLDYLLNGRQTVYTVTLGNGDKLKIWNQTKESIEIGSQITLYGEPANGKFITNSGKEVTARNGTVTQIFYKRKFSNGKRLIYAQTKKPNSFQVGDKLSDDTGPLRDKMVKLTKSEILYLENGVITFIQK